MFRKLDYNESNTKQKKRMEILEHAMDLFIRDGIHNVTMQQIAKSCNISIRSLYYYYKNKEELAVDVQISVFGFNTLGAEEPVDPNDTAYEAFEKLVLNLQDFINNNNKVIKYVAAFDFYFYNSYPNDKYLIHLEELFNYTKFTEIGALAETDGSMEDLGYGYQTAMATVFHSIIAFAQRFIYREKAMLSEKSGNRGDLDYFVKSILRSIKK